ncbi:MAG: ligase-associated DNA damage response endonuclease PdeM [Myxococcota bacterium]
MDRSLTVAGETLELLPERAVFWPARSMVLVADLHWGKTDSFRAEGLAVPAGLLDDELSRLSAILERTECKEVMILGDLVHDRRGLTERVCDAVAAWRTQWTEVDITLVRGNHDRYVHRMPEDWRVDEAYEDLRRPPFVLTHEPEPSGHGYVLAGHLHPTVELRSGRQRLRLPCFHFGRDVGVLPAFHTFTNGLRVQRVKGSRTFAIAEGAVVEV